MKALLKTLILIMTLSAPVAAQCDYTVVLGDTWGDTWSDGYYDYTVTDGLGNTVTGTISNTTWISPITFVEDTFVLSVPFGGSLDLDYFETTEIAGVQYNTDNFVKIFYQGQLVYYRGDTNSLYFNNPSPMTFSDDTTFQCPDVILSQDIMVLAGQCNKISPVSYATHVKFYHKYPDAKVILFASKDGYDFEYVTDGVGNMTFMDTKCYGTEYVYYKAVILLEGVEIWSDMIAVKLYGCSDRRDVYLDGRNGGSQQFYVKDGILNQ